MSLLVLFGHRMNKLRLFKVLIIIASEMEHRIHNLDKSLGGLCFSDRVENRCIYLVEFYPSCTDRITRK